MKSKMPTVEERDAGRVFLFGEGVVFRSTLEEEEWFNQQSFKGTSWNYVLDEAEKHFKCSLNSEMNLSETITHNYLYKLWSKLKEEEEEEERDIDFNFGQEEEKDDEEEEEERQTKQYWAASDGSITLFDYNNKKDDVEDYIVEKWGNCEYGEFSSFTDLRNEEEEDKSDEYAECSYCGEEDDSALGSLVDDEYCCVDCLEKKEIHDWFDQQGFKGTSWNYVLDEAEKHFKCSLNSEMNEKEKKTHDFLYKLWSQLKEEEEEEEEWFNQQSFKGTSWNYVLDEAKKYFKCTLKCKMEKSTHDYFYKLWNELKEEDDEERYCDNEKCPYEGYCFGEVKEQFEGKPYICEGCVTGKGLQEQEETNPFNNDTLWKEHGKVDLPYWNRLLYEDEEKVENDKKKKKEEEEDLFCQLEKNVNTHPIEPILNLIERQLGKILEHIPIEDKVKRRLATDRFHDCLYRLYDRLTKEYGDFDEEEEEEDE